MRLMAAVAANPVLLNNTPALEAEKVGRGKEKKSPCKSFLETLRITTSENPLLRNTATQFSELQRRTVPLCPGRGGSSAAAWRSRGVMTVFPEAYDVDVRQRLK